jgi:hypothetical protein
MKKILMLIIGLLMFGVNAYAASGDLVVGGNATIMSNATISGNATVNGTIRGATYGYGGMYSTSSCYGCRSANPFTGDCSCPAGFTAQWLQQFPENACGWYTGNMYVCNK